jgi:DNA-binding NtrC family response regulator
VVSSREVLTRLNAAAGKLAATVRTELSSHEATDILLMKPCDLDKKLLEYEHELIKQALAQSEGKVTHAASLLGKTYQGLAHMIETKHKDLMKVRSPVRRRAKRASHKHR